jgi:hypothetical protein
VKLSSRLPDSERFSVLMAVILLAYASARFVNLPLRTFSLEIGGFFLPLQFNINTVLSVLVAALTASGMDWLLRGHPKLGEGFQYSHWLLPALTAWVISLPLANLPLSPLWWLAFLIGALLLTMLIFAEYVSVDPEDRYYAVVSIALTALAYGMFLTLAISLKALGARLVLTLPALLISSFLISYRVQLLRSPAKVEGLPLLGIAFVSVEIAGALHYWPLSAISYGLALLGVLYALNNFLFSISEGESTFEAAKEPSAVLLIFWILAALIR